MRGRLADFPHQFSGGMRQRVAIAMALALEPAPHYRRRAGHRARRHRPAARSWTCCAPSGREAADISVILITHDISVVAYACDRMAVMYAGRIVEEGPVAREVLQAPAHPYTMGLANAFPDLHGSRDALIPIYGEPPDLHHPPTGCRFRPRCPFVLPVCVRDVATTQTAPAHDVACWRHDEAPVLRRRARELATWESRPGDVRAGELRT
jgi:peptide/nickel transport system ATP-binding protein